MFFSADTLDDLMHDVLTKLLDQPFEINASRGKTSEIFGVLLQLENPLARLSLTESRGKPFSALGELLWYLTKSNQLNFIEYYVPKYKNDSDDGITIHGGYGSRLFNMHDKYDQIDCILKMLKKKPDTRRAVIQLFDARDTSEKFKEIPCTCTLQFVIRNGKLNMFTSMRSNDACIGLPHDIFCFTMIQEIIARTLEIDLGIYSHAIGSLHLYEIHKLQSRNYLNEGYQSTKITMPAMPKGNPWENISILMEYEAKIRNNEVVNHSEIKVDKYWIDLIKLLQIHSCFKSRNSDLIVSLQSSMDCKIYNQYIENKVKNL
jgi:thymidylate synthase